MNRDLFIMRFDVRDNMISSITTIYHVIVRKCQQDSHCIQNASPLFVLQVEVFLECSRYESYILFETATHYAISYYYRICYDEIWLDKISKQTQTDGPCLDVFTYISKFVITTSYITALNNFMDNTLVSDGVLDRIVYCLPAQLWMIKLLLHIMIIYQCNQYRSQHEETEEAC